MRPASLRPRFAGVGQLVKSRRLALLLVVSTTVSALAEAVALVMAAQLAAALSGSDSAVTLNLGPLSGRYSTGTILLAACIALVAKLVSAPLAALATARLATATLVAWQKELFSSFTQASWAVQAQDRQGFLQELATSHVLRAAAATTAVCAGVGAATNFLALLVAAFVVQPWAALAVTAAAVVLFVVLRPLTKLARRYARERRDAALDFAGAVSGAAAVAKEIAAFGVADEMNRSVDRRIDAVAHVDARGNFTHQVLPELYHALALAAVLLALALVEVLDIGNVAALGAIVLLFIRALLHSRALQSVYHAVLEQLPYVEQLTEQVATYRGSAEPSGTSPLDAIDVVELDGICFAYGERQVLHDVAVHVTGGEVIGIVGPSGAGKSTLVDILLRLRSPRDGAYLINGRPAEDYDLTSWHRAISFVPQDPRLLDGTVSDNIRFFRPGISQAEVERAAHAAHIDEEIRQLPDAYETELRASGAGLSGGQRQRLCMARALLTQPLALVLDEPTSALDGRSERLIKESLLRLRGQVTIFIVAHRLATLSICDRIMVLNDGRLEAVGTADELRRDNAYFQQAVALSRLG